MKKIFIAFLTSVILFTNTICIGDSTMPHYCYKNQHIVAQQFVYRTETGNRYHVGSCRYLKYSKFKLEKSIAEKAGLTPCKICKPNLIY